MLKRSTASGINDACSATWLDAAARAPSANLVRMSTSRFSASAVPTLIATYFEVCSSRASQAVENVP